MGLGTVLYDGISMGQGRDRMDIDSVAVVTLYYNILPSFNAVACDSLVLSLTQFYTMPMAWPSCY